jgi:Ca2+-binding RTX toxin-like protein
VANVVSGSQALRLGALNIGAEFNTSSVYSSDAGAYFLLPTAYNALSGEEFNPEGPGIVPATGTVAGWAKYSYDGTPHFTFTGLDVPVATWNTEVGENDTTGLLTAALSGDDTLTGGALADELLGFAGDDELDGGAGADTMAGGADNDTYIVDNVGDRVTEAPDGGDADAVESSIAYTLGANVENLELTGTAASGTGNAANNTLIGNDAANVLAGGAWRGHPRRPWRQRRPQWWRRRRHHDRRHR